MSKDITVKVEGLEQIQLKLKQLPKKIAKNVLAKMGRAGASMFIKKMRQKIPANMVTYRKALRYKQKSKSANEYNLRFTVGPTTGKDQKYDAWYAHILEFGADAHDIKPMKKKALIIGYTGDLDNIKGKVTHPGIPPGRYMTRTFQNDYQEILNAVVIKGETELAKLNL